mmetsp:Transcript_3210/g.9986  ORF Transcript_3210/g.9986 Transcript_3210/m.9986 type:complete len:841 (+) Transcript_3210:1431-3953(+)
MFACIETTLALAPTSEQQQQQQAASAHTRTHVHTVRRQPTSDSRADLNGRHASRRQHLAPDLHPSAGRSRAASASVHTGGGHGEEQVVWRRHCGGSSLSNQCVIHTGVRGRRRGCVFAPRRAARRRQQSARATARACILAVAPPTSAAVAHMAGAGSEAATLPLLAPPASPAAAAAAAHRRNPATSRRDMLPRRAQPGPFASARHRPDRSGTQHERRGRGLCAAAATPTPVPAACEHLTCVPSRRCRRRHPTAADALSLCNGRGRLVGVRSRGQQRGVRVGEVERGGRGSRAERVQELGPVHLNCQRHHRAGRHCSGWRPSRGTGTPSVVRGQWQRRAAVRARSVTPHHQRTSAAATAASCCRLRVSRRPQPHASTTRQHRWPTRARSALPRAHACPEDRGPRQSLPHEQRRVLHDRQHAAAAASCTFSAAVAAATPLCRHARPPLSARALPQARRALWCGVSRLCPRPIRRMPLRRVGCRRARDRFPSESLHRQSRQRQRKRQSRGRWHHHRLSPIREPGAPRQARLASRGSVTVSRRLLLRPRSPQHLCRLSQSRKRTNGVSLRPCRLCAKPRCRHRHAAARRDTSVAERKQPSPDAAPATPAAPTALALTASPSSSSLVARGVMSRRGSQRALRAMLTDVTAGVGTFLYASPEQIAGRSYDARADVYSLGMVLFELLHPPFGTRMERCRVMAAARRREVAAEWPFTQGSASVRELLMRLLAEDPGMRPSADEVVKATDSLLGRPQVLGRELRGAEGGGFVLNVQAKEGLTLLAQLCSIVQGIAPGATVPQYGVRNTGQGRVVLELMVENCGQEEVARAVEAFRELDLVMEASVLRHR